MSIKRVPIPFDVRNVRRGVNNEIIGCQNIRLNHGLFTQCPFTAEGDAEFCARCVKHNEKQETGAPKYGTIDERSMPLWAEKQLIHFTKVMEICGLTREVVMKEAERLGVVIDEAHFIVPEVSAKRGRPRKVTAAAAAAVDTDDDLYDVYGEEAVVEGSR